jgi:hypothetical protein
MPRAYPQTVAAFWWNLLITHDWDAPAGLDFTMGQLVSENSSDIGSAELSTVTQLCGLQPST